MATKPFINSKGKGQLEDTKIKKDIVYQIHIMDYVLIMRLNVLFLIKKEELVQFILLPSILIDMVMPQ